MIEFDPARSLSQRGDSEVRILEARNGPQCLCRDCRFWPAQKNNYSTRSSATHGSNSD